MTSPDPRLVAVIETELAGCSGEYYRRVLAHRVAEAVWAWLAEGDTEPPEDGQ